MTITLSAAAMAHAPVLPMLLLYKLRSLSVSFVCDAITSIYQRTRKVESYLQRFRDSFGTFRSDAVAIQIQCLHESVHLKRSSRLE